MKTRLVAIIIPVYKEIPSNAELTSIKQCIKVLYNYPIIFCAPDSLKMDIYRSLITNQDQFQVRRFEDHYFIDTHSYNRLMLDIKFYHKFNTFEFILIYQPDAYVFRDELAFWCKAGYDYIGAPWFEDWDKTGPNSAFLGVGNGGFSLRKVKSHIKVLKSFSYLTPANIVIKEFLSGKLGLKALKNLILNLSLRNNTFSLFNDYQNNEDIFWGTLAARRFDYFKTPSMQTASRFSMELNAEMLYKLNGNKLPFGCHAWEKYETAFWEKFIPMS